MLPIEMAKGELWLHGQFLCDVDYDISPPMTGVGDLDVQRIVLTLNDQHCDKLIDTYELVLVLDDGRRCSIPRPLQRVGLGCLECYVESPL